MLSLHNHLCKGLIFALHVASTGAVWALVVLAAERVDAGLLFTRMQLCTIHSNLNKTCYCSNGRCSFAHIEFALLSFAHIVVAHIGACTHLNLRTLKC